MQGIYDRQKDKLFFYWAINWPHYPLGHQNRDFYEELPHPRNKYAAFMSPGRIAGHAGHLKKRGRRIRFSFFNRIMVTVWRNEPLMAGAGHIEAQGNLFEGGIKVPPVVSWPCGYARRTRSIRDRY